MRSVWNDPLIDVPASTMMSGVDLIIAGLIGAVIGVILLAAIILGFAWWRTHLGGNE